MIKTTIIALIEGRRYEFTAELAETAAWADTADETAIGLLHDSMDQLAKAIERDTVPVLPNVELVDETGVTRQCYLCGFYHDEPGSCATGEPTNITAGPDDEPEYDGPTMDYGEYEYVDDAEETPDEDDEDSYHGPEEGDYRESTFPTLDEILETGRPYTDDEHESGVPANVRYQVIADAIVKASKRDDIPGPITVKGDKQKYDEAVIAAVDPAVHPDSKIPPLVASLRAAREHVVKAVVEASKRDEDSNASS